jgi:geranyl-CoA carboxylase alpha subunit
MFEKVLVANRGEIAVRIIRACKELNIRTVAVYSEIDANSMHVQMADEAICIGKAASSESYLRIDRIISAAEIADVDAIHPGYGFLSENAHFAEVCESCNIRFIGPQPRAMNALSDKAVSRALAKRAGVETPPGSEGIVEKEQEALAVAKRIGYPVMIKAVAGGGGRGMRIAHNDISLVKGYHTARTEAEKAFGNSGVYIEKFIENPHHIEIQILGDSKGKIIHLGERDCSVQRRHQKLIEEAPSPAVSPELRARMGAIAVNAIKSIGYEGAGTLEFLLDASGNFYFMEMNTRLQVEHPVTEAVTGLDLVELQLRVASGEPLGLDQDDITFTGHAIEVRLCSEDAAHDFMPQSGRMALWQMPGDIRVEHALQSGSVIPPFYDSMIAKLISHGATRDAARRQLVHGLEQTVAFGVTTNQAFLAACLAHPAFAAGDATTSFIGRYRDDLLAPRGNMASDAALAALLLYVTNPTAQGWRSGRSLAATFPVPLRIECDHGIHELEIARERDGGYVAILDGGEHRFEIDELGGDSIRFRAGGRTESAKFFREEERLYILHRGVTLAVRDLTLSAPAAAAATGSDGKVRAAMNGRVVAVLVKQGERVAAGQPVMTLEAMKMEHVHSAPIAGVISAIDVAEGEQVTTGKVVVEIEAG